MLRAKMELQVTYQPFAAIPPFSQSRLESACFSHYALSFALSCLQLRAAFDASGRLRSLWYEDKACAAAAAACSSEVTSKLSKLLPSLTTITVSVSSEPPALLAKIPLEIKASYSMPNAGDSAKEQKQQVKQPPPLCACSSCSVAPSFCNLHLLRH
jgi:hypothetical protein